MTKKKGAISRLPWKAKGALALAAFILLVGASVAARGAWDNAHTQIEDPGPTTSVAQVGASMESATFTDQAKILSQEQMDEVAAYNGTVAEVADILDNNLWTSDSAYATTRQDTAAQARFARGVVYESKDGQELVPTPFVIKVAEAQTTSGASGAAYTAYTGSADMGEGDVIFTLKKMVATGTLDTQNQASEQPWVLTCQSLKCAKTYYLTFAADSFALEGVTDGATKLMGGKENVDAARAALADVCASSYPTTSVAHVGEQIVYDMPTGAFKITVTLNNAAKTKLVCFVDPATHAASVEKAR